MAKPHRNPPHIQWLRSPPDMKGASAAVITTRSNRALSRLKINDGSKRQRKDENPRYSCDRCYQLKSPVEARLRVSTFTDVWHRGRDRGSGGTFQVEPHRITEVMGKP